MIDLGYSGLTPSGNTGNGHGEQVPVRAGGQRAELVDDLAVRAGVGVGGGDARDDRPRRSVLDDARLVLATLEDAELVRPLDPELGSNSTSGRCGEEMKSRDARRRDCCR